MTDSPSASKPTAIRYLVLAWACSLSMITYIDRVCFKQVQSEISADLGISKQDFGWLFAAFGLSYALFEVPSGWLGDRMGPRKVLARIVVWWSVFTALTGFVYPFRAEWNLGPLTIIFSSWGLMLIVRFLFGMGEAGAYPNLSRGLRSWFPYQRRGFAQGLMWMFARWGGAVAPPMIALFAMPWGWRGAFVLFGFMGIVWVVFFWVFFRDTPEQHPAVNRAEREIAHGKFGVPSLWTDIQPMLPIGIPVLVCIVAAILAMVIFQWPYVYVVPSIIASLWALLIGLSVMQWRRGAVVESAEDQLLGTPSIAKPPPISWSTMLSSKSLWALSLMYLCSNAGWCFFITWDTEYYKKELHLSGTGLLVASGAPLFFGGIACLTGGLLTDLMVRILGRRWGRTLQGLISYALGGAFFLLAMWLKHPLFTVAFLCLASFLKDMAMGVSWATSIDLGHRYSGTVSGFMNMIGNMGTFFGPPIVAALAAPAVEGGPEQWQYALIFSAVMFFLAALGWAFIDPRRVIVYSDADHARLQSEGAL